VSKLSLTLAILKNLLCNLLLGHLMIMIADSLIIYEAVVVLLTRAFLKTRMLFLRGAIIEGLLQGCCHSVKAKSNSRLIS